MLVSLVSKNTSFHSILFFSTCFSVFDVQQEESSSAEAVGDAGGLCTTSDLLHLFGFVD